MKRAIPCLLFVLLSAPAQEIKFPAELERLASKAIETTNVTLDSNMLKSVGKTLAGAPGGVSNLKGIWVRSYKFAKAGEYSPGDLEAIRAQLRGSGWTSVVSTRSKNESADVAVKREGDRIVGFVVLAAEPEELTFVNIEGPINLDELGQLGGQLGIPKVTGKSAAKGGETKK